MKLKLAFMLSAICCMQNLCAQIADSFSSNILKAVDLKPFGRTMIDKDENLELISSAVHFGFHFHGKECTLYTFMKDTSNHGYIQYELDGDYKKRIRINDGNVQQIKLIADKDDEHTVWVYKATEATSGAIIIQKIEGDNITALNISQQPTIEFIGNSITCGAAADTSDFPCGKGAYQDYHNAYNAYGPRVARALDMNYVLSCVSGIGIYRTWNMDSPSMPLVYEKESFSIDDSLLWNFKTYTPKIVSIALGTNDLSNGDGVHARKPFDSSVFVKDYIAFVQLVKSKYPEATIALLSSAMVSGDKNILLQHCLAAAKQNIDSIFPKDKPVALFFFKAMKAGGCSGHPSVEDHAVLADELLPFFKSLL